MGIQDIIDKAPLIRREEVKNIFGCKATSVQVAGTNGKGSTCAFLSSVLRAHGKRVGLYLSPHVNHLCERISVDGENILLDEFERLIIGLDEMQKGMCKSDLMFFSAVQYFNERNVDFAVFETGMGGTRDSATLIRQDYGIITQIGLDHTEYLGDTIEKITGEKAGIIKAGMSIYAYPNLTNKIIEDVAARKGAKLTALFRGDVSFENGGFSLNASGLIIKDIRLNMKGDFQGYNCACALLCAKDMLGDEFDVSAAKKAVENTEVFGRMTVLKKNPLVMADVSHNPDGVKELCRYIKGLDGKKCAVVSIQKTKDSKAMIKRIKGAFDFVIGVKADSMSFEPEALEADYCAMDLEDAYSQGIKKNMDIIVFCGSFVTVRKASALKF